MPRPVLQESILGDWRTQGLTLTRFSQDLLTGTTFSLVSGVSGKRIKVLFALMTSNSFATDGVLQGFRSSGGVVLHAFDARQASVFIANPSEYGWFSTLAGEGLEILNLSAATVTLRGVVGTVVV